MRIASVSEVFRVFLRLGLTSFGGPIAHLGYFREEFVDRCRWLSDEQYAELVALCKLLPGPASSQVWMAIGLRACGTAGLVAAWFAFTLPSAVLMYGFAVGLSYAGDIGSHGWIAGMKAAAVAVVALSVVRMAHTLAAGAKRATIAVASAALLCFLQGTAIQLVVIALSAVLGWLWLREVPAVTGAGLVSSRSDRLLPPLCLAAFLLLLGGLPLLVWISGDTRVQLFNAFYRTGSLVFGGGHVVLPLLQAELVDTGLVGNVEFITGYGAAQMLPGPLFAFSAYLGAVMDTHSSDIGGAVLALIAIFLPAALLIAGVLPFWDRLRENDSLRRAVAGVNAAVVGLLCAALFNHVIPAGIPNAIALMIAVGGFALLWRNLPPWIVVPAAAIAGAIWL